MKKLLIASASLCVVAACDKTPEEAGPVTFEFVHPSHDERFRARTSDPDVIASVRAELDKPMAERTLHINGALQRGDGGVNAPWSWSFKEAEWRLAETSIEVCDGWPSLVEEKLDTILNEHGSFCPWSSRVESEVGYGS